MTLDQLKKGEKAIVTKLAHTGSNHIRLMDLGILPGTHIQAELVSPLGDPTAYRVRETLIALRRDQASQIEIERLEGKE
jgi:ferrous iron transport protein A